MTGALDYHCRHCPAVGVACSSCDGTGETCGTWCRRCKGSRVIEVVEITRIEVDELVRNRAHLGVARDLFQLVTGISFDRLLLALNAGARRIEKPQPRRLVSTGAANPSRPCDSHERGGKPGSILTEFPGFGDNTTCENGETGIDCGIS